MNKNRLNIKDLWLKAFHLYYRKSLPNIWLLGLIAGLSIATTFIVSGLAKTSPDAPINIISIAIAIVFIVSLMTIYTTSLILFALYNINLGKEISWKNLFALTNKKYIKVLTSMSISLILSSLGLHLFLLPGIFIMVLLIMVQPLVLIDDHGIISSLKSSCKLVWGNWWHIFFSLIFPFVFVLGWTNLSIIYAFTNQKWLILGASTLATLAFYPLFYSCIVIAFGDLKIRKNINAENRKTNKNFYNSSS